ncbi:MAG: primosomal protein N' [Flavobacteriaceae bacterium]|nr:primosomal protein N' [Flavobacteriaceae bacterium]
MYFINVILPLALPRLYTYQVDDKEVALLKPGMRVAVEFGKRKIYTALVHQIHQNPPLNYEAKPIHQIIDEQALVNEMQLKHWEWMADYYMCSLGEVYKSAVPSSLLLESETVLIKNENFIDENNLSSDEFLIIEALENHQQLPIDQLSSIVDGKKSLSLIRQLIEKNAIRLKEEINEIYQPKLEKYIKLHSHWESPDKIADIFNEVKRAAKQRDALMTYFSIKSTTQNPIKFKTLTESALCSAAVINALVEKELLEIFYIQVDRVRFDNEIEKAKILSQKQIVAFDQINNQFNDKSVVLLKGVTGSGKTEIYVKLIQEQLDQHKQVLYLLPEIALTTQIIQRLKKYFGNKIAVYHSKYSLNERVEVWNNVLNSKESAQLVVGVRSSGFLPFQNLGLIIVDEEHEPSYKQVEPSPRYHARDTSIVLAMIHNAKVLLGSATPSLESFYNSLEDKYGFVTLENRFGDVQMPEIELVDIKEIHRKKRMNGHFSERLIQLIKEALHQKEQVILFQNRRGYAPVLACKTCGVTPQCIQCDVSLTYHKFAKELKCHYCGYTQKVTNSCVACGSDEVVFLGFGTEQIENEIQALFPEANVARMDYDTTKGKHSYERILEQFQQQEIDILVGTQMLSKGLDFNKVSLVGVLNADSLLNFPDFRAHERSYQLLVQVAGRAGRTKRGKVIIQTYNPTHEIIEQVAAHDYLKMAETQLKERQQFQYPPFYKTINITLKHKNKITLDEGTVWLSKALKNTFGNQVLGPTTPVISKIRNKYIKEMLIKIPFNQSLQKTKIAVNQLKISFLSIAAFRSIQLIIDVDSY